MAKKNVPNINDLRKFLTKENLLPVYFLCGEDEYAIEQAVDAIEKAADPFITSDFDRQVVAADKSLLLSQIFDFALAFPFGGGKKFILLKDFDKINEKRELLSYLKNAAEFTILVITQPTKIQDFSKEPYATLIQKNFLFEAKPLKGADLVEWLLLVAKRVGVKISEENAKAVIELVGEQKSLLEMQVQKFYNYLPQGTEITFDEVKKLSSPTREYSIFDFLDALGKGDKAESLKIGFNLLDAGLDLVYIINMTAKYIFTIAQIFDLSKQPINDYDAAKKLGTSYFYYINCKKARFFMSDERLYNASRALLNADISIKNTGANPKTTMQILVAEMLGRVLAGSGT